MFSRFLLFVKKGEYNETLAENYFDPTRTLWLNLLKSNAAIRGWLTVFRSDMEAQGEFGQPVASLIVA